MGINYLGDWGTQFGKLIVAYKKWSSADRVAERGIEELVDIYVRFSDESEKEPSLNDQARAAFAELERGNEEYLAIWRYFKEISLREYMKTYELLGIEFDSFDGESFFTDKMPAIVEELREKGLLVQDDGAWIVDLAPYGMPPALILKRGRARRCIPRATSPPRSGAKRNTTSTSAFTSPAPAKACISPSGSRSSS